MHEASAYLNGVLVAAAHAAIPITDRGLTLGDGVFETIAVHGGRLPFLDAHLARLEAAAAVLGLAPPDGVACAADVRALIAANSVGEGFVRITVTRGSGPRGLMPPDPASPSVIMVTAPARPEPPGPATAVVATVTRRNQWSPVSRIKALGGYLDAILALGEARTRGADEALLCNTEGRLACATSANLFALIDGVLVTPPAAEGVLEGIVRRQVLTLAREDRSAGGLVRHAGAADATPLPEVVERPLTVRELASAEEAFLTNVAVAVRPLVRLDGQPIGTGAPGPLTRRLGERYRCLCRDDARERA